MVAATHRKHVQAVVLQQNNVDHDCGSPQLVCPAEYRMHSNLTEPVR